MSPKPRLLFEPPNIENTIPSSVYQNSFPEKFSLDDEDKFVLYGGGSSFSIRLPDDEDSYSKIVLCPELMSADFSAISLFVLNTALIIWFNNSNVGLEIPYQMVILHAIKTASVVPLPQLYLQIVSNEFISNSGDEDPEFISSVELNIIKNEAYAQQIIPLFSTIDPSIEQVYESLSKCSALHYDDEESDSEEFGNIDTDIRTPAFEMPKAWLDDNVQALVTGDADDLGIDIVEPQDAQFVAGMDVDVGFASIAGTVRKREDDAISSTKARRVN
ncbi:low temperature responsive protein [Scheffersomyces coipomensis]|uniref:low temperature responsive protein n=1 Tax=Scheffersomyces coipomensis TaxID=1788519 RepID=UPI00315D790A